jgi:hypothetical protein
MCIGSGASKRAIFLQEYLKKRGSTNSHLSLLPCHTPGMYWRDQCPPGMSFQLDIWFVWLSGSARHHRMFIANDFLIAGEEDLCLPSKVMDFEAKHKEHRLVCFVCARARAGVCV